MLNMAFRQLKSRNEYWHISPHILRNHPLKKRELFNIYNVHHTRQSQNLLQKGMLKLTFNYTVLVRDLLIKQTARLKDALI